MKKQKEEIKQDDNEKDFSEKLEIKFWNKEETKTYKESYMANKTW